MNQPNAEFFESRPFIPLWLTFVPLQDPYRAPKPLLHYRVWFRLAGTCHTKVRCLKQFQNSMAGFVVAKHLSSQRLTPRSGIGLG